MAITDDDIAFLIAQRLLASAPVKALVDTRVRPDTLDPNETLPALRYEVLASDPWGSLNGGAKEARTTLQIDCYGATRVQANTLAAAVTSNLDGFTGDVGNQTVFDCVLDNKFDAVDPPEQGSKHWRKRRTLTFRITHTVPTPSHQ